MASGRKFLTVSAFFLADLGLGSPSAFTKESVKITSPCPTVELQGDFEPGLSKDELHLVCGDPQGPHAWKTIPLSQARYNLKNFLQQRGYLYPEFKDGVEKNVVVVGKPTRVTELLAEELPDSLRIERKRKVVGEILTPALLGEVEKWVTQRLQALGYPCPTVKAFADPSTGGVLARVETGPLQLLETIVEEPIPGTENGVLRRYDAFRVGKLFNGDLLTVAENRVILEGFLENLHFSPSCGTPGAVVRQDSVPGPPRLLSVGFGINTEGLIQVRLSWRNARVGNYGSLVDLTALASTREQRINASSNWYFHDFPSRQSLRPLFEVRHQSEEYYEIGAVRGQFAGQTTWDNSRVGLSVLVGPTLDFYRTFRGYGPRDSRFLSMAMEVALWDHYTEYYRTSPRTGFATKLTGYFNTEQVFSDVSAQRLRWTGEVLWNYRDYDPPLWVLGLRGGLATTLTSESPGPGTKLPPNFLQYLGGSTDLRGFGRQELPNSGQGGLTSAFVGGEVRLSSVMPFGLEPFAFLDLGMIGQEPLKLEAPLYSSPGLGIRLASPIGIFRTTFAHGYPGDAPGHFQFYLSYGEEF